MKHRKSLLLILILPAVLFAGSKLLKPYSVLELESIGFPTVKKARDAWSIRDMMIFNGKLFLGHGDAVTNTGPTDIIFYDFDEKDFFSNFTVDDEAIYYYKRINDRLMIPGIDATEDWSLGNFYVLADTAWIKYRTIPRGLHVNDLAWFNEKLFSSTGSLANIGQDIEYGVGGVFVSADTGKTWSLSYATPSDENSIYRIQNIIVYQNRLYAFPFALSPIPKQDIPEQYHAGLDKPIGENDEYLILTVDIFGQCDVLVYDNKTWRCLDIIPADGVCYAARPFVFKDILYIPVLSGEYIDYLNKDRQIVDQAETRIFGFDGHNSKEVKFDYDRLVDVLTKDDTLYLLIEKDNLYYIAETQNMKKWYYYLIPPESGKPISIEYLAGIFYIGSEHGNIFTSANRIPAKNIKNVEKIVPAKFHGAAELSRDAKWYWITIDKLENLGSLAQITAEVKFGNVIKINTENIDKLRVFPPEYHLDPRYETILIINGQVAFEGLLGDAKELICTRSSKDDPINWTVEKGSTTFDAYTPKKYRIGTTEIELTRADDDELVGYWKAEVIKDAARTDLGLVNFSGIRADVIASNIFLEDIYDAHYRNTLCTFKASGKNLTEMLEYNLNQPDNMHCNIAGFTIKYAFDGTNHEIIESTLESNKKYTVAIESYLAERALQYFGRDIDYTRLEIDTYQAMIEWFDKNKTIRDISKKIIQKN